ncbi:hypothetical protein C8R43DRAFT_942664 [Mycena crocata]|nr:hypothetical protein C8R43DRAFT_942664 [Mycena crocata]
MDLCHSERRRCGVTVALNWLPKSTSDGRPIHLSLIPTTTRFRPPSSHYLWTTFPAFQVLVIAANSPPPPTTTSTIRQPSTSLQRRHRSHRHLTYLCSIPSLKLSPPNPTADSLHRFKLRRFTSNLDVEQLLSRHASTSANFKSIEWMDWCLCTVATGSYLEDLKLEPGFVQLTLQKAETIIKFTHDFARLFSLLNTVKFLEYNSMLKNG